MRMINVKFPYGNGFVEHSFDESRVSAVLTSAIAEYTPDGDGETLVRRAMADPVGSKTLGELAKGKKNIVIIHLLLFIV